MKLMQLQSKNKENRNYFSPKRISRLGLLCALAVIMGYVEGLIIIPGLLPGMKVGLANAVIIFILATGSAKEALIVSVIRILIVNSMFGNMMAVIFSVAGALLSILVMWLVKKTDRFSFVGMSICGGVFHNLGQTIVAMIVFSNIGMFYYFPILVFFGLGAGLFIGILSSMLIKRVKS